MFTRKDIELRSIFVINCLEERSFNVHQGELLLKDTKTGKTLTKFPFQKLLALFIIGHATITTPMMELCRKHGVFIAVVKPNLRELCSLFDDDGTIDTWWDALPYGRKLIEWGAQNALLSLGAEGALLFTAEHRVWHLSAPHGTVKNAVGSGDAMFGGFLSACASGQPLTEALRRGIAAGSATAFSEWIAHRSQIDALLAQLPQPTELLCRHFFQIPLDKSVFIVYNTFKFSERQVNTMKHTRPIISSQYMNTRRTWSLPARTD